VLDHIDAQADEHGLAPIGLVAVGFPARKRSEPPLQGMRIDLRHMANPRDAGSSEQNKGLLELGWLE
jgi:hypothetical protein